MKAIMRAIMRAAMPIFCAALLLPACAPQTAPRPEVRETPPKPLITPPVDDRGTGLVGPGGGALLGSVIGYGEGAKASIIAGLAIGYALRGSTGPTLSGFPASAQRDAMARIMEVPIGTPIRWSTASEHANGEITPIREYRDGQGRRCRDFTEKRSVRGTTGNLTGTACLPA